MISWSFACSPKVKTEGFASNAAAAAVAGLMLALASGAGAGETFRLLSYNIHHGEGMDGKLDLARIAERIRTCQPDAVALQEVDRNCKRTGGVDMPAELARLTGMTAHFQKAMDFDGGGYGICLLTKGKVLESKGYALPNSSKPVEPRTVQTVKVEALGGTLTIANTHLDVTSGETRLAQTQFLIKTLGEMPDTVVLAGDFNAVRGDTTLKAIESAGWAVPLKQGDPNTIPSGKPDREIDFAVFRPAGALKVVKYTVLNEPVASDHRPILVEVERATP
ncbi:MAG: endonuclease [Verrucomicrobiaceae bacterium]|nr:MAG: endonuclease [Verrucomicrobiaceae bacterium]